MDTRHALDVLARAVQMLERRVAALEGGRPPTITYATDNKLAGRERAVLIEALAKAGGIQAHAAVALGISPRVMHYKVTRHNLHAYCRLSRRGRASS